jgi:hypothetical protein
MSASNGKYPPTEVQLRTTRRRFTAAYKRRIVEEAVQCAHGELGALLRRVKRWKTSPVIWSCHTSGFTRSSSAGVDQLKDGVGKSTSAANIAFGLVIILQTGPDQYKQCCLPQ